MCRERREQGDFTTEDGEEVADILSFFCCLWDCFYEGRVVDKDWM